MNKKLSIADIKSGILVDVPELITVEVVVKGKVCNFETYIKIMDYSTTIAQMQANKDKKEALASILADCIVNEKGESIFTEDEIRLKFNKPLIEAIWNKILEKNFLGKVSTPKKSLKKPRSGQNSSSTGSVEEQSQKPNEPLATESLSSGNNIEQSEAVLTSD
ncbi:MAG TPA: hypothetical protein DCM65_09515 [Acinetobacter junii]|nr:phage tail assembly chaperone family protein, TAC [Acinetobacter sp.]HAK16473.1 hypothetical protein [Acinetobacter junii]